MADIESQRTTDKQLAYALLRLILGMNIAVHGLSRIYTGVKPVSYTHLDVYKRQQWYRAATALQRSQPPYRTVLTQPLH